MGREKCSYFGVVYFLEVFTFGGFTVLSHLMNLQYILFFISRFIFIKIESYYVLSSNGVSQFSEIVTVQLTQLKFSLPYVIKGLGAIIKILTRNVSQGQ